MSVCVCVCVTEREKIEMKQSSPYVQSYWNILAISQRLAGIIWAA